jgi:hypothetical protein
MNNWQRVSTIVLKCAGLGLPGAVLVLSTLKALAPDTGVSLLALGMVSLALAVLQKDA